MSSKPKQLKKIITHIPTNVLCFTESEKETIKIFLNSLERVLGFQDQIHLSECAARSITSSLLVV